MAKQNELPPLRVSYRYAVGNSDGWSEVSIISYGKTVGELNVVFAEKYEKDRLVFVGSAVLGKDDCVLAFPARSVIDMKIRLATPLEIGRSS